MSGRRSFHLVTTALTAGGLLLAPVQSSLAQMYTPGPVTPAPAAPQSQTGDPPARVGRLGLVQGTVSFHTADEDHWRSATLNYPVSDGNAFWTDTGGLARIDIDASTIWLNAGTEFDVNHLDVQTLQGTEPQGETYLHLRSLPPGNGFVVQTPRGAVSMAVNGRYEIAAGDTDHPTTVTVLEGAAQITGPGLAVQVQANQTATINGTQTFQGSVGPATRDGFLTAMLQREQPALPANVPAVVSQMTGCDDLAQYGSWQPAPDYGEVWYPQVDAGWVPYREGHWAYVAPWGWTWIDSAPWGFAPFHYGRWAQINNRWGWIPVGGDPGSYTPVYAPALVTFFGIGAAVGIGAAAFAGGGHVGWVPLGPREPYYPPYRASNSYLQQVNRPNVTNIGQINNIHQTYNTMTVNSFVNHGAATVVPASAMAGSRMVAADRATVAPTAFAGLHPVGGRPVIAPTAATVGVTPGVAQQMHFAAPSRAAAPGPAVNPAAFRNVPGRPGAAPPLRPAGAEAPAGPQAQPGTAAPAPGQPRPEQVPPGQRRPELAPAGQPGPAEVRPQAAPGLPALRPPGAEPGSARGPGVPGQAPTQSQGAPRGAEPERAAPVPQARPAEPPRPTQPERAAPARPPEPAAPPRPAPEARPPVPVQHEAPRPEARPEARPEPRPAEPPHPAAAPPRPEPRPAAPPPRPEAHPPAPPPHQEARPAPRPEKKPDEK